MKNQEFDLKANCVQLRKLLELRVPVVADAQSRGNSGWPYNYDAHLASAELRIFKPVLRKLQLLLNKGCSKTKAYRLLDYKHTLKLQIARAGASASKISPDLMQLQMLSTDKLNTAGLTIGQHVDAAILGGYIKVVGHV